MAAPDGGAPVEQGPDRATRSADELLKLDDLRLKGVLTDAEFEAAKARCSDRDAP